MCNKWKALLCHAHYLFQFTYSLFHQRFPSTDHSCSGGLSSQVTLEAKREDLLRQYNQTAVQLLKCDELDKTWFFLSLILCTTNFKENWNIHPRYWSGQQLPKSTWAVEGGWWESERSRHRYCAKVLTLTGKTREFSFKTSCKEDNYFHTETVAKYSWCLRQPCVVRDKCFQRAAQGALKRALRVW